MIQKDVDKPDQANGIDFIESANDREPKDEEALLMKHLKEMAQMIGTIVAIISPVAILSRWIYQSTYCNYYNLPVQLIYDSLDVTHFIPIILYCFLIVSFLYLRYKIIQADLMMKVMKWLKIYKQNGKRPLLIELVLFVGEIAFLFQSYTFIVKDRVVPSVDAYIFKIVILLLVWSFCSDPISLIIVTSVKRFIFEKVGKLNSLRYTLIILGGFFIYFCIVSISYHIILQQSSFLKVNNVIVEDDNDNGQEKIGKKDRFYIVLFETETFYMVEEASLYLPGEISNNQLLYIYTDHCKYIDKNNIEVEEMYCDKFIAYNPKAF